MSSIHNVWYAASCMRPQSMWMTRHCIFYSPPPRPGIVNTQTLVFWNITDKLLYVTTLFVNIMLNSHLNFSGIAPLAIVHTTPNEHLKVLAGIGSLIAVIYNSGWLSLQQTVGKQLHTNAFSAVWAPIVHYEGNRRLLLRLRLRSSDLSFTRDCSLCPHYRR